MNLRSIFHFAVHGDFVRRSLVVFGLLGLCAGAASPADANVYPATGAVGLGTASPAAATHVHVKSSTNASDVGLVRLEVPNYGYANQIDFYDASGPRGFVGFRGVNSLSPFSAIGMYLVNRDNSSLILGTNGVEQARIDLNGNLGIGTIVPAARVHIQVPALGSAQGSTNPLQSWTTTSGNVDSLNLELLRSAAGGDWTTADWRLHRQVDSTYQGWFGFQGSNAGNFVVGNGSSTISQWYSLASDQRLRTLKGSSVCDIICSGTASYVSSEGTGPLYLRANATVQSQLAITVAGNVGIGVDNPTSKLAVNGLVTAKEIKVVANPADYVFADGYRLRPLAEVEAFIAAHQHLPGVPSAKEQEEKGEMVAEMMRAHLEKIEELNLYVIQQQKAIDRLEAQLKVANDLAQAQAASQAAILARLALLEAQGDASR